MTPSIITIRASTKTISFTSWRVMQQEHSSDFIVVKAPSIRQAAQCAGGGSNSAQVAARPSFPAWRANVRQSPGAGRCAVLITIVPVFWLVG